MKMKKMRWRIEKAIEKKQCLRLSFWYNNDGYYGVPIAVNNQFIYVIEIYDFFTNGFSIYHMGDLRKVKSTGRKRNEILHGEGVLDKLSIPDINMASWKTIFESLQAIGKNIIVEQENPKDKYCNYVIGRIEKVQNKHVWVRHFDGRGDWQDVLEKIPYYGPTRVSFESSYVTAFSKYLPPPPEK